MNINDSPIPPFWNFSRQKPSFAASTCSSAYSLLKVAGGHKAFKLLLYPLSPWPNSALVGNVCLPLTDLQQMLVVINYIPLPPAPFFSRAAWTFSNEKSLSLKKLFFWSKCIFWSIMAPFSLFKKISFQLYWKGCTLYLFSIFSLSFSSWKEWH